MADFGEAFNYGMKDITSVLIGGVLSLLSFLLIPLFIVMGYLVRVAETTIKGGDEMPKWDNIGDLLVKGIMVFIIEIVYMIIPLVVFLLLGGASILALVSVSNDPTAVMAAIGGIILAVVIAGIIAIIMCALAMIGILRYAETGAIGEAFAIGKIIDELKAKLGEYVVAWIVLIVIGLVISILLSLLYAIIIGFILAPFVMFYFDMVIYRLLAKIYAKA